MRPAVTQLDAVRHSNFNPISLAEIEAERRARQARMKSMAYKPPKTIEATTEPFIEPEPVCVVEYTQAMQDAIQEARKNCTCQSCMDMRIAELPLDRTITCGEIILQVINKYKIRLSDLKSTRKKVIFCQARFEVSYRALIETSLSFPQIGRALGGRDHTTVLHANRRYKHLQKLKAGLAKSGKQDHLYNLDLIIPMELGGDE